MNMKKYFLIIIFVFLCLFKNQVVEAKAFNAYFYDCSKIDCVNAGEYKDGKYTGLTINSSAHIVISFPDDPNEYGRYHLPRCNVAGFKGWRAIVGRYSADEGLVFCEDNGSFSDSDIFHMEPVSSCKNEHLFTDNFLINSNKFSDVQFIAVYESGFGVGENYYACDKNSSLQQNGNVNSGIGSSSANKVKCGRLGEINKKIPELTSWFIVVVQVAVPVILIIMGLVDFVKALSSQKDDEIKRGLQIFFKRIITGSLIFFIVVIVKLLISLVSSNSVESNSIIKCIDCFTSNKCL